MFWAAHLRERPLLTDPYRRFSVRLHRHTGALILWHQSSFTFTGTLEQCEQAYRKAQLHCALAGWWGLVSFFLMNPIALVSNYLAIRQARGLATQPPAYSAGEQPYAPARPLAPVYPAAVPGPVGPPPGWYADPGGPGQRYWDGAAWTQWTHPR
jgi:hypothetical protein